MLRAETAGRDERASERSANLPARIAFVLAFRPTSMVEPTARESTGGDKRKVEGRFIYAT